MNYQAGPQRENFLGSTEIDTGPQILLAPQALSGPMPLNRFLSDWIRSSFKSEEITIYDIQLGPIKNTTTPKLV